MWKQAHWCAALITQGLRGTVYLIKKKNTGLPDQVRQ
jgi:hypothetical protein